MCRLGNAHQHPAIAHAVIGQAGAVFIDIVAEVDHGVDAFQIGDGAIGIEIAVRVQRAGNHRQHHLVSLQWQGARTAGGGSDRSGKKAVIVFGIRRQSAYIDLDSIIAGAIGKGLALGKHGIEAVVFRDLPSNIAAAFQTADSRPQDHGVG